MLDGGLERWTADGYETTDMMIKKRVCAAFRLRCNVPLSGSLMCYQVLFHFSKGFTFFEDFSKSSDSYFLVSVVLLCLAGWGSLSFCNALTLCGLETGKMGPKESPLMS